MADFRIGSVNADTVQMADHIRNEGLSGGSSREVLRLIAEIREIADGIPAGSTRSVIVDIADEAARPEVERAPARLTALMARLKTVAAGFSGAVQIAEAADRIVSIATGSG